MDYIQELINAIRDLHGCIAHYVETVPVTETFQGQTIWQGDVEVFNLAHHPKGSDAMLGRIPQAKKINANALWPFWRFLQ